MKKLLLLAAIAVSAFTLSSCGNKTKTSQLPEEFEDLIIENPMAVTGNSLVDTTITINGFTADYFEISRLFPADEEGQFFMSVRAILPESNSPITDSLFKAIGTYYSMITDTVMPPVSPINSVEFAKGIEDMGSTFVGIARDFMADSVVYGYQMTSVVEPVYQAREVLTYSVYEDSYTGGAHGDVNAYFVSFNPENGAEYTFETLVKKDSQKNIRKRLVEYIAAQKEMTVSDYLTSVSDFIGSEQRLTVETFPIYHVGLTGDGLVFSYPKYSIAAGFEGCPTYAISLGDISDDLTIKL